jgi:hypothetical protein
MCLDKYISNIYQKMQNLRHHPVVFAADFSHAALPAAESSRPLETSVNWPGPHNSVSGKTTKNQICWSNLNGSLSILLFQCRRVAALLELIFGLKAWRQKLPTGAPEGGMLKLTEFVSMFFMTLPFRMVQKIFLPSKQMMTMHEIWQLGTHAQHHQIPDAPYSQWLFSRISNTGIDTGTFSLDSPQLDFPGISENDVLHASRIRFGLPVPPFHGRMHGMRSLLSCGGEKSRADSPSCLFACLRRVWDLHLCDSTTESTCDAPPQLAEEYSRLTKRIIKYSVISVAIVHVLVRDINTLPLCPWCSDDMASHFFQDQKKKFQAVFMHTLWECAVHRIFEVALFVEARACFFVVVFYYEYWNSE